MNQTKFDSKEEQIEKLYQPMLNYVKKRIQKIEDAEDITQEVFYKLSKSDQNKIANIKSWIYTTAKNTIIDYYRTKKNSTEELNEIRYFHTEETDTAALELSQCVSSFIKELPQNYQNTMILSEIHEVPQKEIAEQLNMNYATVRSKIQRGRKKLKGFVTECCTISQGSRGSILEYEINRKNQITESCSQTDQVDKDHQQSCSRC